MSLLPRGRFFEFVSELAKRLGLEAKPQMHGLELEDEYFAEVGIYLIEHGMELLVLGSAGERELCQKVSDSCGNGAVNLAGKSSLPEFAGVLSLCELTVCNDSGGMHLAAAVGSKVIAVFGLTDPVKTGPMGSESEIVAAEGVETITQLEFLRSCNCDLAQGFLISRPMHPKKVSSILRSEIAGTRLLSRGMP